VNAQPIDVRPLGIGIVGCGNIAGPYALDIATHPELALLAAADLDPGRAAAFATKHGCRPATLDELLADDAVDLVVNLTVHHAHHAVTKRALEAGKHVYSEKPLALDPGEADELVALARRLGLRLGASPATYLGEAQQTAGAVLRSGRLGTVRAVYAEVNWGRIESWHPAPVPFFDVGVLVDVGVYPLTLITAFLGPARTIDAHGWMLKADRVTTDGEAFRIGSPDLIIAMLELADGTVVRLTASFYVGRPAKQTGMIEFHGDTGSLAIDSFQQFDAAVEFAEYGGNYRPVPFVREPYPGTAWARGVAEMASAISEDRPHRVAGEHAAHVVEILAAARESMRNGRPMPIRSEFAQPALMDWATVPTR